MACGDQLDAKSPGATERQRARPQSDRQAAGELTGWWTDWHTGCVKSPEAMGMEMKCLL